MPGLRGRRLTQVAALLLLLVAAAPVSGQFAETDEVIEKPSKEGEGRKLDASGLTNAFALLVNATRSIDSRSGSEDPRTQRTCCGRRPTQRNSRRR